MSDGVPELPGAAEPVGIPEVYAQVSGYPVGEVP